MTTTIATREIPLQRDKDGTIWVIGTRIPLDTIVYAYRSGDSAEEIAENFPVLKLSDVYAVISYYLDNQRDVEAYLKRREAEANRLQAQVEARFPPQGVRERLLSRHTRD
ncbi:MAG: DUF433 domain-containing protein [Anaerolineales bacterium]|nr:DUF433 domain-containing protein [Anaerolineales bacterium]